MRAVAVVAAGLLAMSSGAASTRDSALRGTALLRMCEGPQSGICAAYFIGFINGAMMSDAERSVGRAICLSGVSANALRRAYIGFSRTHRTLMNHHADSLVATAAAVSFPCRRR